MIPHQLQIKNFLSYGPETQTIEFSNYHLICLSGKNGHGKSALLDAITWAIWGQARKTSANTKPDSGLVHLGQKHMMVILEFEVNGTHYRIRREFVQTASKPFASLDFGMKNAEGKLIALTDKTIKDTQEKIERTIGITFESFTNSTFLRQGQSNEFSKKSPKERKEILAQILQLQKFEQQKRIAVLHTRKLHQDWTVQTNIKSRIMAELESFVSLAEQYATATASLESFDQKRQTWEQQKAVLDQEHKFLQEKINQQALLLHQKEAVTKNITLLEQELIQLETELGLKTNVNRATLKQQEQEFLEKITQLQQVYQKQLHLKEEHLTTKETLNEQLNRITQTHQQEQQTLHLGISTLQQTLVLAQKQRETEQKKYHEFKQEAQALQSKCNQLLEHIEPLKNCTVDLEQAQQTFEKQKTEYQKQSMMLVQLQQECNQLALDRKALEQNEIDQCKSCLQAIPLAHQPTVLAQWSMQQKHAYDQMEQLTITLAQLKPAIQTQHQNLQHLRKQCELFIQHETALQEILKQQKKSHDQLNLQETLIGQLNQSIITHTQQLHQAQIKLQQCSKSMQEALHSNDIAKLKEKLQQVELALKDLMVNPSTLPALQAQLHTVQQQLIHTQQHDPGTQKLKQEQALKLQKTIKITQHDLELIQEKLEVFATLTQEQKMLAQKGQCHAQTLQALEHDFKAALINKGSLEQKQKKQIELETELRSIEKTIHTLHQELTDYQEIARALGKDGIQALLIEQALPEIEHETNQILARLTNNQTQIFIESLRDLKRGGSKETLDIKISDSFGLRDYEMFSGGEAFRIDFALRIGISKLLARRAGTTLQTIFIDEGFGSQDEEGLQLIMDNIYKIQDDFAKIIIVSHLPEMKEQFPVQFVIEKKRSGSTVSVIHQG
jgi:exonuclease SbcC